MPRREGPALKLRLVLGDLIALGPGKAELLDAIRESGSISAAARSLGMGYRRAWALVEAMNEGFRRPLVEAAPGGARGGGARITPFGEEVLAAYRRLQAKAEQAVRSELAFLRRRAARRRP